MCVNNAQFFLHEMITNWKKNWTNLILNSFASKKYSTRSCESLKHFLYFLKVFYLDQ